SSDDGSFVCSNEEPDMVRSVDLRGYDGNYPRPVSPTLGIIEQEIATSGYLDSQIPRPNYYQEATQTQAYTSTFGASPENLPMDDESRNTSVGSIIRDACKEQRGPSSPAAHGSNFRGIDNYTISGTLETEKSRSHALRTTLTSGVV